MPPVSTLRPNPFADSPHQQFDSVTKRSTDAIMLPNNQIDMLGDCAMTVRDDDTRFRF